MFDAPDSAGVNRWPVLKIRAGCKSRATLLGTRFLPVSSHWVGRTVLCAGPKCRLCEILPTRGLFYLPVAVQGRATILELSPVASSHLEQHAKLLHGGLSVGQEVEFSRAGAKKPLYAEIVEQRVGVTAATFIMFVSRVMALFHLPSANPSETIEDYEARLRKICIVRNLREFEKQTKTSPLPHAG